MIDKARFWGHALGASVAMLSLCFIAALVWLQREAFNDYYPKFTHLFILFLGCMAYAGAGYLLTRAWHGLLHWSGEDDVDPDESRKIYARTQLAKYIPGNFAQVLSRHVVGRQAGWSHTGLLLSTVFEILSLLCVAAVIGIIGLASTGVQKGALSLPLLVGLVAGLTTLGVLLLNVGPPMLVQRWPDVATRFQACRVSDLWPVILLHAGFFIIGGLLLLLVTYLVAGPMVSLEYWPALISLFAASWTAGMITPGAPSGIGVRETVLVLGLSVVTPVAGAVVIASLLRLLTIGGDVLFFLLNAIGEGKERATGAERI